MSLETGPLRFFNYRDGILSSEGVALDSVIRSVGTPVYVYSTDALLKSLGALKSGLSSVNALPCFAVKSNSNLAILRLLVENGAGLDIVSGGELFRGMRAGCGPSKIVFSGVGKTEAEIKEALTCGHAGIFSFNVESVEEARKISAVATALGKKAPIALRYNPDVNPKTHPYISTGLKKNKFGMDRKDLISVASSLPSLPGLELRGLSIHIGSQLLSLAPLDDAFARLKKLVGEIEALTQRPLDFVDLGGGLGISYGPEKSPGIQKYCALVLKHFGPGKSKGASYRILLEPGRMISGNSGVLLTRVLYRRKRKEKDFLIVDAAMNDLIRPALYQSHHEIVPVSQKLARGKKTKADIVGPVCETADCFASARPIPSGVDEGDFLAILSAGAYGFSMSSQYNSRPRPPEVLIRGRSFSVIRQRETLDDLIRGEMP